MTEFVDLEDWVIGDSRDFQVTLTDNLSAVIDISSDLLMITFKADPATQTDAQSDLQVKQSAPVGGDSALGIGYINVEASDTSPLLVQKYSYDIQYVQKSAVPENVFTLQSGKVAMKQQVGIDTT